MSTTVLSASLMGVDALPVEVEVDLLPRLPAVSIVGLPTNAVRESAERVRSAVETVADGFPRKRVVINLAPADLKKEGTALDLPMALAILAADGQIPSSSVPSLMAAGELSLDGRLRPVRGALSMALTAREHQRTLILPTESARIAALVPDVEVWAADTLGDVVGWLTGTIDPVVAKPPVQPMPRCSLDLADVRGQPEARAALEVAAAGAHHLLLMGPPGCGKSMLAQRLPSILPELSFEEALSCTRIHSAAGLLDGSTVLRRRPFRAPHHTVTVAGLVGDRTLRPGEVALAHQGVLFLDEASEFRRSALEVLRQPLEDGHLVVSRARGTVRFPAHLTLVLASNPCPCGYLGSPTPCRCTDHDVANYRRRLSGPILDRIDLHVHLEPVSPETLLNGSAGEDSSSVRTRVLAARQRQADRLQRVPNGRLSPSELDDVAPLSMETRELLATASRTHRLSARATRRLHRVARTLADLAGRDDLEPRDIAGAFAYRPR